MEITEFSAGWEGTVPIPALMATLAALNEFGLCWTEVYEDATWSEAVQREAEDCDSGFGDGEWDVPPECWEQVRDGQDVTLRTGVVIGPRGEAGRWNAVTVPDVLMP